MGPSLVAPAVHARGRVVSHATGVAVHVGVDVEHGPIALHLSSSGGDVPWNVHHVQRTASHGALLVVVVPEVGLRVGVQLQVLGQLLLL